MFEQLNMHKLGALKLFGHNFPTLRLTYVNNFVSVKLLRRAQVLCQVQVVHRLFLTGVLFLRELEMPPSAGMNMLLTWLHDRQWWSIMIICTGVQFM